MSDLYIKTKKSDKQCPKCGTRMGLFDLMGKRYKKCPVCDHETNL